MFANQSGQRDSLPHETRGRRLVLPPVVRDGGYDCTVCGRRVQKREFGFCGVAGPLRPLPLAAPAELVIVHSGRYFLVDRCQQLRAGRGENTPSGRVFPTDGIGEFRSVVTVARAAHGPERRTHLVVGGGEGRKILWFGFEALRAILGTVAPGAQRLGMAES